MIQVGDKVTVSLEKGMVTFHGHVTQIERELDCGQFECVTKEFATVEGVQVTHIHCHGIGKLELKEEVVSMTIPVEIAEKVC
jgi:hypothetical protein